jgi:anti-sigma regulatory factor (Ser/Thr protein kinase)
VITRAQIGDVMGDGGAVVGHDGADLGTIGQVFLDALSSEPLWMTVTSDLWDGAELVVPLALARLDQGRITVPYSATVVEDAPRADTSRGCLGREHEEDLVRHYGLDGDSEVSDGVRVDGRVPETPLSTSASGTPARPGRSQRSWRLPCIGTSVRALRAELRAFIEVTGLPDEQLDDLVLAASEAAANVIEHARSQVADYFDVFVDVYGSDVRILVRDYGRWRDPKPENGSGRGLLLMSVLATLTVTVEPKGTTVSLRNRSTGVRGWSFRRRR